MPQGTWQRPRGALGADTNRWVFFILLHIPLITAVKFNAYFATLHALIVFALGLACLQFRTPERLIYAMGYIMASEPLWRVGHALIFYESAKYAISGLSILALLRYRLIPRSDKTALVYMMLLLPSILVLPEFDRRQISFNLSGPWALAMTTLFLSTQRISVTQVKKLCLIILAPILGFAFVATFSTVTTDNINFYSSKIASGGLGNNQASSFLGLGLVLGFFYLFIDRENLNLRIFIAAIAVWCGGQAALTFSRGGVLTALGGIAAGSLYLIRDRKMRGALVLRIGVFVLIAVSAVVPVLNTVTGGALADRFSDRGLTGRDKIIEADLIAFRENPIFGVGPGMSKDYHARTFRRSSAHTEYSRLLAEHGLFGLAAMLLLGWITFKRLLRAVPNASRGFAVGFTVWALLFMFHASMRMAAVSFIFALGSAYLLSVPVARPRIVAVLPGPRRAPTRSRARTVLRSQPALRSQTVLRS